MMLCQNLWIELYTQTSQVCTARAEAASGILVKHTVVTNLQVPTSPAAGGAHGGVKQI